MKTIHILLYFLFLLFFISESRAQVPIQELNPKLDSLILGDWTNDSNFLHIHENNEVFLELNRSCGAKFPIKIIDSCSFEIIWDPEIDCVFNLEPIDIFNLKESPKIGKPFAKYTLADNTLEVKYYYPLRVKKSSKQKQSEEFIDKYSKLE